MKKSITLATLVALTLFIGTSFPSSGRDRTKLLRAIEDCKSGNNHECAVRDGYVIVKAFCGPTDILLIPDPPLSGIEDPHAADRNYWKYAWEEATNGTLKKFFKA